MQLVLMPKSWHSQVTYSDFQISDFLNLKKTPKANASKIFFFSIAFLLPPAMQPALNQGANLAVNTVKTALISVISMQRKQYSIQNIDSRRQLGFLELLIFPICCEWRM